MIMWVIDIYLFAFLLNRLYGRYSDFIDVWMSVEYKPVAIQKKKNGDKINNLIRRVSETLAVFPLSTLGN